MPRGFGVIAGVTRNLLKNNEIAGQARNDAETCLLLKTIYGIALNARSLMLKADFTPVVVTAPSFI